jgi:hypothetical protein
VEFHFGGLNQGSSDDNKRTTPIGAMRKERYARGKVFAFAIRGALDLHNLKPPLENFLISSWPLMYTCWLSRQCRSSGVGIPS